ncbi:MAG: hypothetical protein K8F91_08635 [Candidatus Obscuribacterales bacterium]|nr:hypothetical protein [Candidatus Obscuribacterales bacterium]
MKRLLTIIAVLLFTSTTSAFAQGLFLESSMTGTATTATQSPDKIEITIDGTLAQNTLLGIPGTTMPANYRISANGVEFGVELPTQDMQTRFQPLDGRRVRITGTLIRKTSESPDGTQHHWLVVRVDSYMVLTN